MKARSSSARVEQRRHGSKCSGVARIPSFSLSRATDASFLEIRNRWPEEADHLSPPQQEYGAGMRCRTSLGAIAELPTAVSRATGSSMRTPAGLSFGWANRFRPSAALVFTSHLRGLHDGDAPIILTALHLTHLFLPLATRALTHRRRWRGMDAWPDFLRPLADRSQSPLPRIICTWKIVTARGALKSCVF